MSTGLGCAVRRHLAVLLWLPLTLFSPVLHLVDEGGSRWLGAVLLVVMVAATVAATLGATLVTGPAEQRLLPYAGLAALAAAVVAATSQGTAWLPTWSLLAITAPTVLRGRWLYAGVPAVAVGAAIAAYAGGMSSGWVAAQGFLVFLAGYATASFLLLNETIADLRRTREELARTAVAEERERFSRDLHDLLGHTLSVMVVKTQAVRRLVHADPDAAARHAADVEEVGRGALLDVRRAVDAMRTLSLAEELEGAIRALDAAGIAADVVAPLEPLPESADHALAWVVREGATNVLRHSGASHCRFSVDRRGADFVLTVSDDGVGAPRPDQQRTGGLGGLQRRLVAVGGGVEVDPGDEGFRLTARVPAGAAS